jgi:hypothetical protein
MTTTSPASGSLSRLANKEFYIRNRWRCDQNESRCDQHLSFTGDNVKLYAKDNTTDLVPWKLIPVPGKTGEFYIRNRWRCDQNESRCDQHLSFSGDNVQLAAKDNTTDLVPWKLIPVHQDSLLGVGTDNELYTRDTLTSNWVKVPNSGSVTDVTIMPDGTIVGIGMNNQLYTRATLTSNWVNIPNSGSVTDITIMPDGTIVGIGMNNQLYTRATLTSNWVNVPNSGQVISVAASNGLI